jgi:hypothetical protein
MSRLPSSTSGRKDIAAGHHEIAVRYQWHARDEARSRRRTTSAASFASWQPRYSAHGIPTFPVHVGGGEKKPSIRGWQCVGLPGSAELARKFPDADAFGFCPGPRSRLTILDIDTDDERVLADALGKHGKTPIIVRTGSGKFHAWYRNNRERRLIRPFVGLPIDVLGSGFVVAPPSKGAKSSYQIIEGSLDDLDRLPLICNLDISSATPAIEGPADKPVIEGRRNRTVWEHCMRGARYCDDLDALIDVARTLNEEFSPPLDHHEVMKIAKSAWGYTERGVNRFGQTGAWFSTEEANTLIATDPDGFLLLAFLRANNGPESTFMVANGLEDRIHMPRKRLAAARTRLVQSHLDMVRPASKYGGPALYRWKAKGGQN